MAHKCHWPGCDKEVPPKLWGCSKHWFTLPKSIRDKIWSTYRTGQEFSKKPSTEYLEAAAEAQKWIKENAIND
jgi:hypothetical protein